MNTTVLPCKQHFSNSVWKGQTSFDGLYSLLWLFYQFTARSKRLQKKWEDLKDGKKEWCEKAEKMNELKEKAYADTIKNSSDSLQIIQNEVHL